MDIKVQQLQEAVALLNQGRQPALQTVPTPPPPPAVAQVMTQFNELNSGISVLVSMSYQSISGNKKDRDILIRRVIHSQGAYYIDGVAMDIRAPRLIKVANISSIRDIGSGKVYTDPYAFLRERLGVSVASPHTSETLAGMPTLAPAKKNEFPKVLERCAHEMTVLMYLVAIDGVRRKSERDRVIRYVQARTTDLQYDVKDLNEYLISLAPDEESFTAALARVLAKDKAVVQPFVETILDVIMADGHVDDKERAFLIRIMDLLEQDGYDIDLMV